MKKLILTISLILVLLSACTSTPTVNVEATVAARLTQEASKTVVQGVQVTVAKCPFYVYQDYAAPANHFYAAGWMGDIDDFEFDDNYKLDPQRPNVIKISYAPSGAKGWSGIYWWSPANNDWGAVDGGFDLSCAKKLTFLARGENGGEKGEFKVGGLNGTFQDSLQPALSTGPITLTKEWVEYSLDLTGKDLSHIIGGFVWVTNKEDNDSPATIYIDEIKFE